MERLLSFPRTLWRSRTGRADRPRLLTYIVSFSCNARCVMCDSWRKPPEDELSLGEIERIFRQLPRLDAVRLTGGEPTVRRDLREIHDLAVKHLKPFAVHITSNAFLTDRLVALCEERDRSVPLHLMVSLDGHGDTHNTIRGHESAWRKAVDTLERLAPRQKELKLRLAVNQTIVGTEGMRDYPKLHEMLRELGIRHHVVMAYETSATYSLTKSLDVAPTQIGEFVSRTAFDPRELGRFLDRLQEDLRDLPWPERWAKGFYLRGIRERILEDEVITANPRCVALSSHLRLYPNGDVPTCQFNSKIVGNLRRQPFEELWRSGTTEKQRGWVRQCPGCWAECEVLPNAIYSGQLLQLGTAPGKARHSAARAKSSKEADARAGSGTSSGVIIRSSTS